MKIPDLQPGQYLIVRVDGSEERIAQKPTIAAIHRAIGCEMLDTVNLRLGPDGDAALVMVVNGSEASYSRPVNHKASEIKGRSRYPIHGDVAIVCDSDLEPGGSHML